KKNHAFFSKGFFSLFLPLKVKTYPVNWFFRVGTIRPLAFQSRFGLLPSPPARRSYACPFYIAGLFRDGKLTH
ncbi:TPA: hypothetical protein ACGOYH_002135, partial [Streptococcus suis]